MECPVCNKNNIKNKLSVYNTYYCENKNKYRLYFCNKCEQIYKTTEKFINEELELVMPIEMKKVLILEKVLSFLEKMEKKL